MFVLKLLSVFPAFLGFILCLGRGFLGVFLVFGFILVFAGGYISVSPGFSTRFSLVFARFCEGFFLPFAWGCFF